MADEQEQEQVAPEKKKSGKKTLIIVSLLLMALLGGGGYAAMIMLAPAEEEETRLAPPSFLQLEPFVITLKSESRARYLQIKLSLMTRDESSIKALETYSPMIRNEVISYLGSLSYEDVKAPGFQTIIREEALTRTNALLEKEQVEAAAEDLIITDLVIQ